MVDASGEWAWLNEIFFKFCSGLLIYFFLAHVQYFHPDNMSSAEKLKLELKQVRDEFKISETDCGSTRVQSKYPISFF